MKRVTGPPFYYGWIIVVIAPCHSFSPVQDRPILMRFLSVIICGKKETPIQLTGGLFG
jgi:hypothetical protein